MVPPPASPLPTEREPAPRKPRTSGASDQRRWINTDVVVRKLQSAVRLSDEAVGLIRSLNQIQRYPAGATLSDERSSPMRPGFLLTGWAAKVRTLSNGRRQIVAFVLPGDALALSAPPHRSSLAATVALTAVNRADARPIQHVLDRPETAPDLAQAVHAAIRLEEALLHDHIVRLGRQTAYERMCHLMLEFRDRLATVGLAHQDSFPLPLTQEMLADATGLSVVHVNRVLQQLRSDGLIELRGGRATLLDHERMGLIADYRPATAACLDLDEDEALSPAKGDGFAYLGSQDRRIPASGDLAAGHPAP